MTETVLPPVLQSEVADCWTVLAVTETLLPQARQTVLYHQAKQCCDESERPDGALMGVIPAELVP